MPKSDRWVTFAAAALRSDSEQIVEHRVRHACEVADAMCEVAGVAVMMACELCPGCQRPVAVRAGRKVSFHLQTHYEDGCGYAIATLERPTEDEYINMS